MSKCLETLERLRKEDYENDNLHLNRHCCYVVIEKELKALEIIKETRVDVVLIKLSKDYDDYCSLEVIKILSVGENMVVKKRGITQQEYDLLKEVFE